MENVNKEQESGSAAPAQTQRPNWAAIFEALDAAQIPHDFLGDRDQGMPEVREQFIDVHDAGIEVDNQATALSEAQVQTAKVFMSGRSQAVRIPAAYRFSTNEVFIRRDPATGNLILSEKPTWKEVFAALDAAGYADDFLSDRGPAIPAVREKL